MSSRPLKMPPKAVSPNIVLGVYDDEGPATKHARRYRHGFVEVRTSNERTRYVVLVPRTKIWS